MQKGQSKRKVFPAQKQKKPGSEKKMIPQPVFDAPTSYTTKTLKDKVALITGGDSGIGRAIAVGFARHGAKVSICFLESEQTDAEDTRKYILKHYGTECLLFPGDLTSEKHCKAVVKKTFDHFKQLDILVNNAGVHYPQDTFEDIDKAQLEETFRINVFPMFYLAKAALEYLKEGSCIINTSSVTAYRGSYHLIDYSATKGAIVSFTRSLASALAKKKIRVNAVAPGPVWTPLIVSSMKKEQIETFGTDTPLGRAAQPWEIASCYIFLASEDASYISGQVIHPNGGEIVNG